MERLREAEAGDLSAIRAALAADGGVIVRDYLAPHTLTAVRDALLDAIADLPWCNTYNAYEDSFFGHRTKRLHGLLQYGPEIERVLTHPVATTLAPELLTSPVIMSTGELMAIGPDETQQRLHRDGDSWRRAALPREFLFSVNVALTDFRRENGATVVVPGSHRWPAERRAKPADYAYAEMPAGSALVYVGQVLHSGGRNETEKTRVGLYFGYIPAWLRPLENPVQTHPAAALTGLGTQARALLGLSEEGFIAHF
ncbi:MAG: phytanoyl-CoA dioxygenase family protein [Pseudomonadales bacterium]